MALITCDLAGLGGAASPARLVDRWLDTYDDVRRVSQVTSWLTAAIPVDNPCCS